MKNQEAGKELNQLAHFLFATAADNWYIAIALELGGGLLAAIAGVTKLPDIPTFTITAVATALIVVAYILRQNFYDQYDIAETMRRQSVLSESLDWPISKLQMSEWQLRAGKKIRSLAKSTRRAPDYYSTESNIGPERLAEMTVESAFYTRNLYIKIKSIILKLFLISSSLIILVIVMALVSPIPTGANMVVAQAFILMVPIALTVDLYGRYRKLGDLISAIKDIEKDLDRLRETNDFSLQQVMRLVSEYNCQVVSGIPIHNKMFKNWQNEIKELWEVRWKE
jgi:hypothetical protein